jgi:flagella basal body P-ring formation protein FlgA
MTIAGGLRRAATAIALCASWTVLAQATVTPEQAIAASVIRLLGESAEVAVLDVETRVAAGPDLAAEPDAGARFGQRARFVLSAGGTRLGLAVATVRVVAAAPRAARAIARDEVIGPDAVDLTPGDLARLPMRPLPALDDVLELRARRDIAAGEVLMASVLRREPLVRSGDEVTASLRVGAVTVTALGHASGSGHVGDMIRVMQPNSSRLLRGRITGPGAVEIVE